ncbi:CAP domain-containing protein [Chitinophaga costaii]|nr:CAP domain-containing protein [Chitinophaga costaii]
MSGKINFFLIFCIGIAAVLFTSCTKEAATPPKQTTIIADSTPVATIIDTVADNHINRVFLLQLVNGLRSHGCNCGGIQMPPVPVLSWNGKLEKAAWSHAQDMSLKNYFDHTAPDGSTPESRIVAAGYNWVFAGENIAMGNMDEQAVMVGWLGSPHHCQNMMNANYEHIGIARAGNYWTMELGSLGSVSVK